MQLQRKKLPKSPLTYLLVCIFGIGSWVAINGVWAELSILVLSTPECKNLPALLTVIIQLANVGPLLYTLVKYFFHRCNLEYYKVHLEIGTIIILIIIGILSSILLSFFWNKTSVLFGNLHSVALVILIFSLALVDCTSSVLFIPFMKHFPAEYMSALYIGEGLSGVLPSSIALAQGFVNNSLSCSNYYIGYKALGIQFSPRVYFLFLGGMMIVCGVAFLCIITIPHVHKHMTYADNSYHKAKQSTSSASGNRNDDLSDSTTNKLIQPSTNTMLKQKSYSLFTIRNISKIMWSNAVLYTCLGILSFLSNGALSAISSFAFLPYGNDIYNIAINLAILANPLTSMIFILVPSKSKVITVMMTAITCVLGIYILDMAIMYPNPILKAYASGKTLIVSRCIIVMIS